MTRARQLAIIGGYPPPYGGVTTHLMRLTALLDEAGLDYVLYNAVSESEKGDRVKSVRRFRCLWILWYALTGKEPAVYLASQRVIVWLAGAFMQRIRGKRVGIRLQNEVLIDCVRKGGFRKALVRFALRRLSTVVCVNEQLVEAVKNLGVDPDRVHLFPGFLPPADSDRDPKQVAPEVWEFCESKSPIIAANGMVDFWHGEDMYGLDHLVELAEKLRPEFPDIGIVVCFLELSAKARMYLDKLIATAKAKGVEHNILFNTKGGLFVPVIEKADVLVRPTNTDGDASSIREALFFGIPAVASDAALRPAGASLFRTRDINDFASKVRETLLDSGKRRGPGSPEGAEDIKRRIKAYLDLLSDLSGSPLDIIES